MAKEGFLGALGRFASHVAEAAPDGARNAWIAIGPWVADLSRNASQIWLPHLLTGIPCEVLFRGEPCPSPAVAACSVCRKPTCLNHAFTAKTCQVVCFPCVKQDIADHASPSPGPRVDSPPHARGGETDPGAAHAHEDSSPGPRARRGAPPPRPPPDPLLLARLANARKILKVKRSASWSDVEASYKILLVKHHPDRNPQDRASAEQRYVQVRVAYDLLKQHQEAPP